jgi:hypothetical protein
MQSPAPYKSAANSNSRCADFLAMAEHELSAFFHAVTRLFGSRQPELSAEEWVRELIEIDQLPSSVGEWRSFTARVSTRLASRVVSSPSFIELTNA